MFALASLLLALTATAFPLDHSLTSSSISSNYSLAPIFARTECTPGSVVCSGPTQYGLCPAVGAVVFLPVAPGTQCINGQIVAAGQGSDNSGSVGTASSSTSSASVSASASAALPPLRPVAPVSVSTSTQTVTTVSTSILTVATPTSAPVQSSTSSPPGSSSFSTSTTPSAAPSSSSSSSAAAPTTSASLGSGYKSYLGNGESGWPTMAQWASFDAMWAANEPVMAASCAAFSQPNNSPQELSDLKSAIQSVAQSSGVDARFILAIAMQESKGCVRVWSTTWDGSIINPGMFQDHNGSHSCNSALYVSGALSKAGTVQNPCPASEISGMTEDGVMGTSSGAGLKQCLAQAGPASDASSYYKAARIWNGGSIAATGNLQDGCCTKSYSSDVANRMTLGLVGGDSTFSA